MFKSKLFRCIIAFALVFVIVTNYSAKPVYADPFTITAIAVKVVIVVLSSLGVLAYVGSKTDTNNFALDFMDWVEQKKAIANAKLLFANIMIDSLKKGVKMKVDEISSWIKEYYNETFVEISDSTVPFPEFDTLEGANFRISDEFVYTRSVLGSEPFKFSSDGPPVFSNGLHSSVSLGNGYFLHYGVRIVRRTGNELFGVSRFIITYNNIPVDAFDGTSSLTSNLWSGKVSPTYYDSSFSYNIWDYGEYTLKHLFQFEIKDGSYLASIAFYNVNNNIFVHGNYSGTLSLALDFVPNIGPDSPIKDPVPLPLSAPSTLAFPVGSVVPSDSVSGYVGQPFDVLLDDIASMPFSSFVDTVGSKAYVDSVPASTVFVEDGVITDVDIRDVSQSDLDIREQTGILGSILAWLLGFWDAFKLAMSGLFVPPPSYFSDKFDLMVGDFSRKINYDGQFGFLYDIDSKEIEDIKGDFILNGKIIGTATYIDFSALRNFRDQFQPIIVGFFGIFLAMYNVNKIYFLIRGVKLFGGGGDE